MDTVTQSPNAATFDDYVGDAWPALYRYAYLLTGNHADAEDVLQQALLKAYRSWSRVQKADSVTAYLRRILTNTYLSQRRPKRAQLELLTDTPVEPGRVEAADPEDRLTLWPHVRSLPPQQRAVVVLRYYEGLSEQQIAEVLGCSKGAVKSTAHHALRSLRAAIGDPTADQSDGRER